MANGEHGTSIVLKSYPPSLHRNGHSTLVVPSTVSIHPTSMFHTSLRAAALSRFVSEMYPDESNTKKMKGTNNNSSDDTNNVKHVGAIVHAALTFAARQEYAPLDRILGIKKSQEERHDRMAEWGTFSPSDIIQYIPETVTKSLKSQVGGLNQNLSTLLVTISKLQYPPVIIEIEDALGHPKGGKYEVYTRQLLRADAFTYPTSCPNDSSWSRRGTYRIRLTNEGIL